MANKETVAAFLEALNIERSYEALRATIQAAFSLSINDKDHPNRAEFAAAYDEAFRGFHSQFQQTASELYETEFSDEDLRELTELFSSPAYQKYAMRGVELGQKLNARIQPLATEMHGKLAELVDRYT